MVSVANMTILGKMIQRYQTVLLYMVDVRMKKIRRFIFGNYIEDSNFSEGEKKER